MTEMVPASLQADADGMTVAWPDGLTARLAWSLLRKRCPCAVCRKPESAAPRTPAPTGGLPGLPVLSVAEARPTKAESVSPVGNYGYKIHFNDGHAEGIYSLALLRRLSEELDG